MTLGDLRPDLGQLLLEADRRGLDVTHHQRVIVRTISAMRAKLAAAQTRNRLAA